MVLDYSKEKMEASVFDKGVGCDGATWDLPKLLRERSVRVDSSGGQSAELDSVLPQANLLD